jgi:hypothetical protein
LIAGTLLCSWNNSSLIVALENCCKICFATSSTNHLKSGDQLIHTMIPLLETFSSSTPKATELVENSKF